MGRVTGRLYEEGFTNIVVFYGDNISGKGQQNYRGKLGIDLELHGFTDNGIQRESGIAWDSTNHMICSV